MLRFLHCPSSEESNIFKGVSPGPEQPSNPWKKVVEYCIRSRVISTKVISSGKYPSLTFEYNERLYTMTITKKTCSSHVISWLEKIIGSPAPIVETRSVTIEKPTEMTNEEELIIEHDNSNSLRYNLIAGGSIALAIGTFAGVVIGNIFAEQEEKIDELYLVDSTGSPVDFRAKGFDKRN